MIEITDILEAEKFIEDADAVVFDLDDTLYSEKDYVKSGYCAIALAFPEIDTMFDDLWSAFKKREPAIDIVFARHGILSGKDEALQIYRNHEPQISLYPGAREMLLRIGKTKRLGIITDGRPEGQRAKIKALGLEGLFERIIITDELGSIEYRKPNEAAFRLMAEYLSVPFERMCYVGDNLAKDFIAPAKLGMKCIYINDPQGIYSDNSKSKGI